MEALVEVMKASVEVWKLRVRGRVRGRVRVWVRVRLLSWKLP